MRHALRHNELLKPYTAACFSYSNTLMLCDCNKSRELKLLVIVSHDLKTSKNATRFATQWIFLNHTQMLVSLIQIHLRFATALNSANWSRELLFLMLKTFENATRFETQWTFLNHTQLLVSLIQTHLRFATTTNSANWNRELLFLILKNFRECNTLWETMNFLNHKQLLVSLIQIHLCFATAKKTANWNRELLFLMFKNFRECNTLWDTMIFFKPHTAAGFSYSNSLTLCDYNKLRELKPRVIISQI